MNRLEGSNQPKPPPNGWSRYELHVMSELGRLNNWIASVDGKFDEFQVNMVREITTLKVKAGLWGAVGACIPIIAAVLFILLRSKI